MSNNPKVVFVFSGKRKAGKDYVTERLYETLGKSRAVIIRLSAPIKKYWADLHQLDYSELLGTSDYKERYRRDMIKWSEEKRADNYGYFCRLAVEMAVGKGGNSVPIWIVADARRTTDLRWVKEMYGDKVFAVRIRAGSDARRERGWVFQAGVDDAETECGLDDVTDWNLVLHNDDDGQLAEGMRVLMEVVEEAMKR